MFHSNGLSLTPSKELKFGEDLLKHATGNSKLSEVALVCLLDMCRAATHVKPEDEVPLRMIAFDIAHEIKVSFISLPRISAKHSCSECTVFESHKETFLGIK